MKVKYRQMKVLPSLLATGVILGLSPFTLQSADAGGKFYCGTYDSAPSTMTNSATSGKPIPIIMWKSNFFSSDGWTPEKRCQEVSERFNQLHSSGRLKMLTTGRMNGMPVICASIEKGSGCVDGGLLYTLKVGQNAGATLRSLLAIRTKATGPLTETTQRPYISIQEIEAAAEQPVPSSAASSSGSRERAELSSSKSQLQDLPIQTNDKKSPDELW